MKCTADKKKIIEIKQGHRQRRNRMFRIELNAHPLLFSDHSLQTIRHRGCLRLPEAINAPDARLLPAPCNRRAHRSQGEEGGCQSLWFYCSGVGGFASLSVCLSVCNTWLFFFLFFFSGTVLESECACVCLVVLFYSVFRVNNMQTQHLIFPYLTQWALIVSFILHSHIRQSSY